MSETLAAALEDIPDGLRAPLIAQFEGILTDYRAGRWEAVGLKAGKLCEITYCVIDGLTKGAYAAAPSKPRNMVDACKALEKFSSSHSRSVAIQIPRLLTAIYELRNNRAIGHVGGDVDPNHMDAELFLRASKWIVAELVRVFSKADIDAARSLVEGVTERSLPAVWENNGVKRVLNAKLAARDKVLALSYSEPNGVKVKQLMQWIGYGNITQFRGRVLAPLDKEALIHFDKKTDVVVLSPTGVRHVESTGLLALE